MKKLHKLVINSFVGPFVLTFFIAQFILLMQFLWKYIDDLVGKGLEPTVVAELLFYTSATLVPLALPLAILVSSIMTFGNLAEHFEITAAKAAGISLQKLMRPLFVTAFIISVSAFFFSNNVLPYTNLKMGSLLYDIRQQKPALSIREGVFYNGIEGYSIKVGDKDKDGKTIRNVMIYDHTQSGGNKKVIIAESGTMSTTPDDRFLVVTLKNGSSYEEQDKHNEGRNTHPLMRNAFKSYTLLFDLTQFKLSRTSEDMFRSSQQMMNLSQLNNAIDSISRSYADRRKQIVSNMKTYFLFMRDSAFYEKVEKVNARDFTKDVALTAAMPNALNSARGMKSYSYSSFEEMDERKYQIDKHKVEWHRKLTLSAACFILFLIGAPLGAIIRKGGLGLPLVISVLFFLLYHITSITGEKLSKEGSVLPYKGMWFSSILLMPVGLFLIYKATHDSVIFDIELYKSFFKRFKKKK